MTHAGGTKLGPCVITREIGRGGMGVVYLACDTKLDRDVALKVIPDSLAMDKSESRGSNEKRRFSHRLITENIAAIHGVEDSNEKCCMVLKYVEGETLAARHLNEVLYRAQNRP